MMWCASRAHAVAHDLGQNRRAPPLRALQLFQNQNAGAFAHHESVPLLVPGPRRPLRFVVARRKSAHRRKTADAHRRDAGLASAADHHIGVAVLNQLKESPIECALVVQAVAVAEFGPFAP